MADRLKINGSSSPGQITMLTDKYQSVARYKENGSITVGISKVSSRNPTPFLLIFLFGASAILSFVGFLKNGFPAQPLEITTLIPVGFMVMTIISLILLFVKIFIAKWHGAEHMAIVAYEATGKYDLDTIKSFSRVTKYCGARIAIVVLPLLILSFTVHIDLKWITDIIILAIFALDFPTKLLLKIRPIVYASELLQSYVTTASPGERELLTAQAALLGLLLAHGKGIGDFPKNIKIKIPATS